MADDFNLLQAMADAGGNASGYTSIKEARQFLAMLRVVQAHDAFAIEKKQKPAAGNDDKPLERLAG